MSEINNLLNNIVNIKTDIKSAIENKGQNVTNFASYPNAISNIVSGGGSNSYEGDIPVYNTIQEMQSHSGANVGDLALVYTSNNFNGLFSFSDVSNSFKPAGAGMTVNKEYVIDKTFFGTNGVEQGGLQDYHNLYKDSLQIKMNLYDTLSNLNPKTSITNIANIFYNRYDLINIPYINLNSIQNMENAFYNCINLSHNSYAVITNMLPQASQLTNTYISNIGLNINKFNEDQINILKEKGYSDFNN